jgi:hypothetical protein
MTYKEHRKDLSTLCLSLQSEKELFTVKQILKANLLLSIWYTNNSVNLEDFKTFDEWTAEGYQIKAGEKAFRFWGDPILQEVRHPRHPEKIIKIKDFFPIVFKFSKTQVVKFSKLN